MISSSKSKPGKEIKKNDIIDDNIPVGGYLVSWHEHFCRYLVQAQIAESSYVDK